MEVTYDVELPEAISQIAFGELKTNLTIVIRNAEALAQMSEGKLWWAKDEDSFTGSFVIGYEPEGYNLALFIKHVIKKRVEEIALKERTKNIVVDAEEITKLAFEEEAKSNDP